MNINKLKYLLSLGIKNNMMVYDYDAVGLFSKRLVALSKQTFKQHYGGDVDFLFVEENDLRDFANKECCTWYSDINLKTLDNLKIYGIAAQGMSDKEHYDLLTFLHDCDAILKTGCSKLVLATDKNDNVLLGCY